MQADRALAARVRAILKATAATAWVDVDLQVWEGHVRLAGVVGSEAEREGTLPVAREASSMRQRSSEIKVLRRPGR